MEVKKEATVANNESDVEEMVDLSGTLKFLGIRVKFKF